MNRKKTAVSTTISMAIALLTATSGQAQQRAGLSAAAAAIMKADQDFNQSVAEKNREKFLSLIADVTTFNGGTANELHGRAALMKDWGDFFEKDGPTLTWKPARAQVIGAGDVGVTTGSAVYRAKGPDGTVRERRSEYLTVWRKQPDGTWKVVFDTGSTLPPPR